VRLHATVSAIVGHGLAEALAEFAAAHPRMRVELREETSPAVVQDLLDGRADLGIVTSGIRVPKGLDARHWREERLLVVVPANHPFSARASVGFADVLAEPLVGVLAPEGGALAPMEEEAHRLGRHPHYSFRVASPDAARRLVAGGHGVTVMPDSVAPPHEAAPGDLRSVPLVERWARRQLSLVTRPAKTVSAPTRLLADHLLGLASASDG